MALLDCDRANIPAAVAKADTAWVAEQAPSGEKVDRIEYVNWSQFPFGTSVTRVRTTRNRGGTVVVTTHERLLDSFPGRVLKQTQESDQGGSTNQEVIADVSIPANENAS